MVKGLECDAALQDSLNKDADHAEYPEEGQLAGRPQAVDKRRVRVAEPDPRAIAAEHMVRLVLGRVWRWAESLVFRDGDVRWLLHVERCVGRIAHQKQIYRKRLGI